MKELVERRVKRTEVSFIRESSPQFARVFVRFCTTEPLSPKEIEGLKSSYGEGEVSVERRGDLVCVNIEKLRARPL